MRSIFIVLFVGILFASCASLRQQRAIKRLHIYLLMGQSNMAGRGLVEAQDTVIHPRVFVLSQDTVWDLAKDPLHFDKPEFVGTGLGLTFGKIMADQKRSVRIGLVPCAVGGSSIDQWIEGGYHKQTKSYPYDDAIIRAKTAAKSGIIKGLLWHQGESDSRSIESIQAYEQKFLDLKQRLERDLELERLPIAMGELGYFYYEKRPEAKDMNLLFDKISKENECVGLVKSNGLKHKGDGSHFDSESYRALGERYASQMIKLQKVCK